jgi:hypothetical protein
MHVKGIVFPARAANGDRVGSDLEATGVLSHARAGMNRKEIGSFVTRIA